MPESPVNFVKFLRTPFIKHLRTTASEVTWILRNIFLRRKLTFNPLFDNVE